MPGISELPRFAIQDLLEYGCDVLRALHVPEEDAHEVVVLSFGR